ncbi:MAG TPA: nucleoside deaminase [Streptosporangiaceae bacterium]|nr:nucleoside deaminase [Streptosporangiaceae bacterium]
MPYTDGEYFAVLLNAAMQAEAAGDYGIAAALVIRAWNTELISVGRNAILSSRDPLGHAEINAIRGIQSVLASQRAHQTQQAQPWTGGLPGSSGSATAVYYRPAQTALSPGATESVLYTSLEPCPMCTVAILSSHIERVVIAAPDERGGALAPERLAKLPPAWSSLAAEQGLTVAFESAENAAPVAPELMARLSRVFWDTKDARDAEVSQGVLLHDDIASAIAEIVR